MKEHFSGTPPTKIEKLENGTKNLLEWLIPDVKPVHNVWWTNLYASPKKRKVPTRSKAKKSSDILKK